MAQYEAIAGVSGAYTPGKFIAAGAANGDPTVIKATPGVLGYIAASNVNAAARFLKLYNKATAPTSADTPVATLLVPGAATGGLTTLNLPERGAKFTAGISFRLVTGVADNDNNAVAATELVVNYGYI
jgi:hypothetical protein